MKILLYGGSFDPPHNGHLNNLRAAADRVRPDKIVVMPAGTSPFKQGTNASGALRLEMCRCFAALAQEPGMPPLQVSGWEVAQAAAGSRNYTVLTLEMLARENPGGAVHQRKSHHNGSENGAVPVHDQFHAEVFQEEDAQRPPCPEEKQQEITHHRGRQYHGQGEHHVQHALDGPGQPGNVIGGKNAEKELR